MLHLPAIGVGKQVGCHGYHLTGCQDSNSQNTLSVSLPLKLSMLPCSHIMFALNIYRSTYK